ncbi:MAG: TonB family protein [Rickettsiales bacterium]|nr:TonB family protein [Rickettsiales bacterium]
MKAPLTLCTFLLLVTLSTAPLPALAQTEMAVRYETILTKHLTLHQEYPNSARLYGLEGDAIVRIQVDGEGNIPRFYFVKEAGHPILDKAVIDMLKSAQPLPKPPKSLLNSAGVIELMFPIAFRTSMDKGSLFYIDQLFRTEAEKAWDQKP